MKSAVFRNFCSAVTFLAKVLCLFQLNAVRSEHYILENKWKRLAR